MNNCAEEFGDSASEVKVDSKVRVESEIKAEPEFKGDYNVKVEREVKVDAKVKVNQNVKVKPDINVESEVKVDPKVNVEQQKLVEDREFDFLRSDASAFRRSSSLKAASTPPDTPHQKKAVRFADALGLDLESVRHILNSNEPPIVPSSAMRDLNLNRESEMDRNNLKVAVEPEVPCLRAWFANPATSPDFERQVLEGKIRLATCFLDSLNMAVSGSIRVLNLAYEKSVTVRFTTNAWVTFTDVGASYVSGSGDGRTDYFQFVIQLKDYFVIGSRMEFSLRLTCDGETYWDSNNGCNYRIECCAALNR